MHTKRPSGRLEVERVDAPQRSSIEVGSVRDPAEAQADRLAERALSLSSDYQADQAGSGPSAAIRRSATAEVDGLAVDQSALDRAGSGGQALDSDVRSRLEQGFGADLGNVRVHTNEQAADIARQIHARAFTHGNDVYFGKDEYRPGTTDGDHVLAHEVAHTVQQSSGSDAVAHRFPATWSTSPVPWKPMTASIFRPGEGASGGVYILTSKDGTGPVQKAVVKPVFGTNGLGMRESGQQLQFSDAALGKLLGLSSPTSKVVQRGGSEFKDLVDLCKSKQPSPSPGEKAPSLADAESFVVMSEVPNASSIGSMADKAPTDRRASADLFRAVFDPIFLTELGKLCIGDLMLGNPDRMVLGAMNLGNVMVSMQNGQAKLAAIDTTAYLPKSVDPSKWASSGGSAGGGFAHTKSAMEGGPGEILDGFFEVLVARLKKGTPVEAGPNPTWEVIETTYKNNRSHYLASFDYGWNDAMITALAFADDDAALDSLTDGYDDPDVSSQTLKANLNYLGSRAEGKSHEESIGRSLAIAANGWVQSVNRQRLTPISTDSLAPTSASPPTGKAVTAEVAAMPALPTGKELKSTTNKTGRELADSKFVSLTSTVPGMITNAHSEVDNAVTATKSRRKGVLGSKEDVPRNRSVVSHYIVHSAAMGAGGSRIADAAGYAASIASQAQPLLGADFRGSEAAPVKSLLRDIGIGASALEAGIATYKRQLATVSPIVAKTKYSDRAGLTEAIAAVDAYLDAAQKKIDNVKKQDLQRAAANIVARK